MRRFCKKTNPQFYWSAASAASRNLGTHQGLEFYRVSGKTQAPMELATGLPGFAKGEMAGLKPDKGRCAFFSCGCVHPADYALPRMFFELFVFLSHRRLWAAAFWETRP